MHIHAMTDLKEQRHRAIAELIRGQPLANQEELAERLAAQGLAVTQATISRDLEQLGAVKVRRDGRLGYTLPELASASRGSTQLAAVVRDWVRSIDFAGNLVVLKTPPGSAHLVGVALDQAALPDVVGTICGDDTIFVAVRDAGQAPGFVERLRALPI
jgi:transcriptional regulator of arginine metabolism